MLIRFVPSPSSAQVDVVQKTLEEVVEKVRLKDEDIEKRRAAVDRVERLAITKGGIPAEVVSLFFYGSSMTGLGLQSSDVNVDVRIFNKKLAKPKTGPIKDANVNGANSEADAAKIQEKSKEQPVIREPLRVVWSIASVMNKITQVLKEEDTIYKDVRTDFQVRIIFVAMSHTRRHFLSCKFLTI